MTTPTSLTYEVLKAAVAGEVAAVRTISRLAPAGGPGDKIFPPTYMKEGRSTTKYAMEERMVDGTRVSTVLLDSVASQANRMEEALLEGWRAGDLRVFPVVEVDFTAIADLADLDRITSLQAPHRVADALLRDSTAADGTPFRLTAEGRAFTDSRTNHATGMYQVCPTALVFGCWDSTGPKGGLGSKFQRSLVSEIVGYGVITGVKTASRIDPAGIERKAGTVYEMKGDSGDWTTLESDAALDAKGNPKLFSRKGAEGKDKGTPAGINHGNIPPSIDTEAGGVTVEYAVQTTVLSLPALRRLRFQTRCDGTRFTDAERPTGELAARTALAALALAAIVFQRENDYDLRSRSLLVATGPFELEFLGRDGSLRKFSLSRDEAAGILRQAAQEAQGIGLGWKPGPVTLQPSNKLARLIQVSRAAASAGVDGEG